MALPHLLTQQYFLMSVCVLSLEVVNSGFWEGGPCPWAERTCESWGARDGECVHTNREIAYPQHSALTCLSFRVFIIVRGRLGIVGKVRYWQLHSLKYWSILWEGWVHRGSHKHNKTHTHSSTLRLIRLIFQDGVFFPSRQPAQIPISCLSSYSDKPPYVCNRTDKNLQTLTQKIQNNAEIKVHRATSLSFNLVSVWHRHIWLCDSAVQVGQMLFIEKTFVLCLCL